MARRLRKDRHSGRRAASHLERKCEASICNVWRSDGMTLTENDSGRTFDANAGSTFTVRLKENPTTGYRWAVESLSGLELLEDNFERGTAAGSPGVRVFQFRVPASGSHDLRLHSWREWQGNSSISERFSATT